MKKGYEARDLLLVAALAILAAGYLGLDRFRTEIPAPWRTEKLAAAQRAQASMAAVRSAKAARGISLDRTSDPNSTGMIGVRWSAMTTTLGVLEAKRTSTNPNFAALAVGLLKACGAQRGDRVAVNVSASFPALSIAVLAALDTLELRPVAIASLGASMWGANDPSFTWLDMEQQLLAERLIRTGSLAVSLGGAGDLGRDMDDATRAQLHKRIRQSGVRLIEEADLAKNIAARLAIYFEGGAPACFINVGGNLASAGASADTGGLKPGLIRPAEIRGVKVGGLVQAFLERQIPVIHLLDLKALAAAHGLPFDPVPLPAPGEGSLYRESSLSRPYVAALLACALVLVALYVRTGRKSRRRSLA
jgi:poly-gamma-glutamate system protein